jgi:hypothetical protein
MNTADRFAYTRQLIARLDYMTLATVSGKGRPWNSPVFYAYDGLETFYWGSKLNTQHSQNITETGRGFVVIYDSTVEPGHGEAFYAEVICQELTNTPELDLAIRLLHKRLGQGYMTRDKVLGPERRLYKAVIKAAWVKDLEKDIREPVGLLES